MVGRAEERSWISASLERLREARGGCMFFVGEPGIGKSRLAEEAIVEAGRRDVWVLYGRASATGRAVPYQALTGAVLYGLRSRPLAELPGHLQGVRAGLATLLPGFVGGPAVEPSPVLLGETVLRLAVALGGADGALVVLEDLHWACGDTLAVIEYLADNAALERVVVLGTSRPGGPAMGLMDALDRRGSGVVRMLEPLSAEEVVEMTAACLFDRDRPVPEAISEVLNAHAEGLPFLVEELLAGLVNRGTLVSSGSGWTLSGELVAVNVPLSFSQTVRERLAALSECQRRVVECAAILGRDFDWSYLPTVAHADEAEVLDALSRAIDLQLVAESGGERFRFRHALTVEAILAQMLEPQRRRLAAGALDGLIEDRESVAPEQLALAAHLAAQADRAADASRYLTEEARRSRASGAVATAIATARRARRRLPPDAPEALEASEVLLSAVGQAGDTAVVDEVGLEL
ncbi:MAG: AAA family ATPase, partial [Solirubrobacterales bacterium]|nr:AAA family ATPase [Solirubrobacterales bacterium]